VFSSSIYRGKRDRQRAGEQYFFIHMFRSLARQEIAFFLSLSHTFALSFN
jgi:hypothetical protein